MAILNKYDIIKLIVTVKKQEVFIKKIPLAITDLALTSSMLFSAFSISAQEKAENQQSVETTISVNGTNSFGNMLSDEYASKFSEQQGNKGRNRKDSYYQNEKYAGILLFKGLHLARREEMKVVMRCLVQLQ